LFEGGESDRKFKAILLFLIEINEIYLLRVIGEASEKEGNIGERIIAGNWTYWLNLVSYSA